MVGVNAEVGGKVAEGTTVGVASDGSDFPIAMIKQRQTKQRPMITRTMMSVYFLAGVFVEGVFMFFPFLSHPMSMIERTRRPVEGSAA
jgi:hypothetical protein